MLIAIITEEKAFELKDKEYVQGIRFNPIELGGEWFISLVEAQYLSVDDIVRLDKYIPPIEIIESEK